MPQLPIEAVLPELTAALMRTTNAVLVAPPGAGKTTRVPLALLDESWLAGRRVLMLEPRRLAAKTAARYMAASLGEQAGETVGYRVRMDTKVSKRTRIEVITEGVLTRILQEDPSLEGVGAVIFDEFHERSLHTDLGLALCLEAQALVREDLRIVVMSATLDAGPVSELLGDAPIIVSEGRSFPVETRYLPRKADGPPEAAVVHIAREAIEREKGDLLVFLPGAGEIRRAEARLREALAGRNIEIAPLYGNLPQEQQDRAISPGTPGRRKIVLATSIAETSLTVEGIGVVIDSGLMRVPRFSPKTGLMRLETVPVSAASADQRRGRAGRLAPGVCYRLWTEQEQRALAPRSVPEILEADLAPLALELAAWGAADPAQLRWLDPPPAAAYSQARELLRHLGALDGAGQLSGHGRRMAGLGVHPRLAHMILRAAPLGLTGFACETAALLGERDIFGGGAGSPTDADLRLRLDALHAFDAAGGSRQGGRASATQVDPSACRRILAEAEQWKRALGLAQQSTEDNAPADTPTEASAAGLPSRHKTAPEEACGLLLAFAYPDRIGQMRTPGRFLLSGGRGAVLPGDQLLARSSYLVAAELDDQGPDSRIYLAAPIDAADLEQHFAEQIETETSVYWDSGVQAVRARTRRRLGALILKETAVTEVPSELTQAALLEGIRQEGLPILPWSKTATALRQRLLFMSRWDKEWPDVTDETLLAGLEDWLAPHLHDMKSRSDLQRLHLPMILETMLSWEQRRKLDEQAPTHITVPSGSRIPVDYEDPEQPALAVRLQEMFGLTDTPRIAGGQVPLTIHLLSPAQRPVQVTRDLANFWRETYFDVKKDLKGRYPKHYWPDNPLEAVPTNRVRPRN